MEAEIKSLGAKHDWPKVAKRWQAFWNDEVPEDRVMLCMHGDRRDNPYPNPGVPINLADYHSDFDFVQKNWLYKLYSQEYYADATPRIRVTLEGGLLGILLGGKLSPMKDGVIWSEPFIDDWGKIDEISIQKDSYWFKIYRQQMEMLKDYTEHAIIGVPDFHGISDALVSIRGGENLAFDLMDCPAKIQWASKKIAKAWKSELDWTYKQIQQVQVGSTIMLFTWHPGRMEIIEEDFADLLSPEMYQEQFMHHDQLVCDYLDASMFHLHPSMLRHQDIVCQIPSLSGVQFNLWDCTTIDMSTQHHPLMDNLDLYKRVQATGKKVWYHFFDEQDMKDAIMNGDPRHLILFKRLDATMDANKIEGLACEYTQKRIKELGL